MRKYKLLGVFFLASIFLSACSHTTPESLLQNLESYIFEEIEETEEKKETTTENNIKTSYEGFYYDQLTDIEKTVYQEISEGCQSYESKIDLSSCTIDELQRAETAFSYEHPEFFWISSFTYEYLDNEVISITFSVPEDAKDTSRQMENKADAFVNTLSGTDYDKVKAIYEYIIDQTDYNLNADYNQDIRSVFLNQESVCAGYARAFEYLCQKAGIACTYVSGTARGSDHAWNLIYINDNYYWVDTTWGDPIFLNEPERKSINYDYLCVSDKSLTEHTVNTGIRSSSYRKEQVFTFPKCEDDSLNYYKLQGMYFESYDRETIGKYLVEKIENGITKNIEMKFGSNTAYQEAVSDLITNQNIYDLVEDVLGYTRIRCSYIADENAGYFSITFTNAE